MPYARKRRFRRRARKGKAVKGKTLLRQARTARIDSAAERAVVIIAKREAKKLIPPNLCFRRYLFADYNNLTHSFNNRTDVDMGGTIVHIAQIPKWDAQLAITTVPVADPDLRPQIPIYPRGGNVVAPTTSKDQYRWANKVSIKNIQVGLIFQLRPLGVALPEMDDITIKFALVSYGGAGIFPLGSAPQPDEVMTYPRQFGYSSRLDTSEPALQKYRTLKSGFVKLRWSDYNIVEKQRKLFWSGTLPYEYTVGSQNGQLVAGNKKLFLVMRSNVPIANTQKPTVAAFVKLGYQDA